MAKRSFKHFVEQELGKLPHFVIYALLEWMLIIVLFIDGFLAFFANEFAKFFELRIPCLLCTRIDHVLVRRNPDFYYNDSICEAHKKDVSYLAYCHVHRRLSDIRKMCDGCLLSFATQKESDCDTYKSLVGILHKDIALFVDDDREIHMALHANGRRGDAAQAEKSSVHRCSCCGEPLKVKSNIPRLKNADAISQAPTPSPRAPFVTLRNKEARNMDLPHVRYTELKLSNNESEVNDDEESSNPLQIDEHLTREDVKAATVPLLTEAEDVTEDRTPTITRGNKFFGIPLTDSANATPRWAARISRKSPLEKTEFATELTEESMVNEADAGESILHHLKRQVRLDRKSLMALYMELDEERSASAVAANNAMAMITRLQAEKAAVQMEALQYQRMMEEQAEYDEEALQATNDLLVNKEEVIKVLEAELEAYREKFGSLDGFEGFKDEIDEDYHDIKWQSYSSLSETSECISPTTYSSNKGHNNGESVDNDDHSSCLRNENGSSQYDPSQENSHGTKSGHLLRLKNLDKRTWLSPDDGVHSSESSSDNVNMEEQDSKGSFMRELLQLHERVKSLEADGGLLNQLTTDNETTQENGSGRGKLMTEISDNLQKLRYLITKPFEVGNEA